MSNLLVILVAVAALSPATKPERSGALEPARAALLARGVNLSHWYWLPAEKEPSRRAGFISEAELKDLAKAGFTCVRFPVEPDFLWDAEKHTTRDRNLAAYRAAIDRVLAAGLGVVVDPHPPDLTWEMPDRATGHAGEYEHFWSSLAGALAYTDSRRVVLEVMNEPHDIKDKDLWPRAQEAIVKAIRVKVPRHTIIVTGDDYGGIDGLLRLARLDDSNIIYSFHFYEPQIFTHQGAAWGWEGWKEVRGLKYPADRANADAQRERISHKDGKWALEQYAKDYQTSAKIRERIKAAADWADSKNVTLWCGEFGVYAEHAPPASRLGWLHDVTAALGEHRIGWAMWDYCGGFRLASGEPGRRKIDPDTLTNLAPAAER